MQFQISNERYSGRTERDLGNEREGSSQFWRRIENNNLPLGYVTGHAVNDENDLALIRKIEIILFGAFGVAFLPAFGLLSWSSLRQLEIEQEKTARVSGLIKQLQEAQGVLLAKRKLLALLHLKSACSFLADR